MTQQRNLGLHAVEAEENKGHLQRQEMQVDAYGLKKQPLTHDGLSKYYSDNHSKLLLRILIDTRIILLFIYAVVLLLIIVLPSKKIHLHFSAVPHRRSQRTSLLASEIF